jgi:hypothetical protein
MARKGKHSGFCVCDARPGETVSCPDSYAAFAFCFPGNEFEWLSSFYPPREAAGVEWGARK